MVDIEDGVAELDEQELAILIKLKEHFAVAAERQDNDISITLFNVMNAQLHFQEILKQGLDRTDAETDLRAKILEFHRYMSLQNGSLAHDNYLTSIRDARIATHNEGYDHDDIVNVLNKMVRRQPSP